MLIRYDGRSRAAYVKLLDSDVIESEEVAPGIVYDFDIEDRVRGIEFYHLDSLSKVKFSDLELPLQSQERAILEQCLFNLSKQSSVFTVRVEKTKTGDFVSRKFEEVDKTGLPSRFEIPSSK